MEKTVKSDFKRIIIDTVQKTNTIAMQYNSKSYDRYTNPDEHNMDLLYSSKFYHLSIFYNRWILMDDGWMNMIPMLKVQYLKKTHQIFQLLPFVILSL